MSLEPSRIDFGVLTVGETATRTVKVGNLGTVPLRVGTAMEPSPCHLDLPDPAVGGEISTATLSCRWTTVGSVRERLDVTATGRQKEASQSLEIAAEVAPLLGFRPNYVDFEIAFGERATKDVQLIGTLANNGDISIKELGETFISAAWDRQPPPRGGNLRIECRGDKVGMHAGSIAFALPNGEPDVSLSWGCRVKGTLTVEPSTPYFNLKQSGDRATTVIIKSTKPDFRVSSARVVEGPFQAELRPRSASGEYPILVRVLNRLIGAEARAVTGTLVVSSNDETEPRKSIPLFGMGHVNRADVIETSTPSTP